MLHNIPVDQSGPNGPEMAGAVESCVHCGFCLPTCPTYKVLGEEMDSPRGRIFLMKEVLEGNLEAQDAQPYIDKCLGCQACVTSCPSGVRYGDLVTSYRTRFEPKHRRGLMEKLRRLLLVHTLPHPGRFRLAVRFGRTVLPFRKLFPAALKPLLDLLPRSLPPVTPLSGVHPAKGKRRARVGLHIGCVQQVIAPGINAATVRVLQENGVEVVIPRSQACCGALAMHVGEGAIARATARRNLTAFPVDLDAVISNAAGCGSGMKEYPLLFKKTPDEDAGRRFAERVTDISTFLDELGPVGPPPLPEPVTVAFHDACHLAHAQGIRQAPRRLLETVPGLTLVEPNEWELCCGSAGSYNLEHPEIARELGQRKAKNLQATDATIIATGNIGCMTQIQQHLRESGKNLAVLHLVEILDRAYRGNGTGVPGEPAEKTSPSAP